MWKQDNKLKHSWYIVKVENKMFISYKIKVTNVRRQFDSRQKFTFSCLIWDFYLSLYNYLTKRMILKKALEQTSTR